ncbi:uncharacterized protein LOC132709238 [Pantherophis guttatus]|uniref:Uncharacterized protein LOC132709238 n=1 Tax=Pantherophis guttatus TaxID=94885 RepID=A0ABM3YQC8_PANGU|nr:uncharacterized protein LOC132709238 [Pantherophis guttatus]XP_060538321.1 uncharacterized protein LOC132709238 [Pantherophis guttatus]XP_060538322.1 uncharacterized protein LOC132709238 [Pantherophis guttatus]
MAPKPPPAKGPAPAKQPERPPSKLQECLSGYNCVTLGVVMLFSLFLYTLWYISLCTLERAKREPLRKAVAQLRQYMIAQNAEYGTLNDTAIILEAEKVSRQLLPWAEKIKEIQAEIADIHYKLNENWIAYKSHLYLLNPELLNFVDSNKLCSESKAFMTDIQDDEDEIFLESAIRRKHGDYYIGLTYESREWRWTITHVKAFKYYWAKNQPKDTHLNHCAKLQSGCTTKLKCWISAACNSLGRCICKKKPEDKWMT